MPESPYCFCSVGLDGCLLVWRLCNIVNRPAVSLPRGHADSSLAVPSGGSHIPSHDTLTTPCAHEARDRDTHPAWSRARLTRHAAPQDPDGHSAQVARHAPVLHPESSSVRIRNSGPLRDIVVGQDWIAVLCDNARWAMYSYAPRDGFSSTCATRNMTWRSPPQAMYIKDCST